jgi:hypothetical protein
MYTKADSILGRDVLDFVKAADKDLEVESAPKKEAR